MSRRTRRFVMDRRAFLRSMGLAGAGAMGCGLALPRLAAAQDGRPPPRRVVFMMAEQGWVYRTFRMRPFDAPPAFGQYAGAYLADPGAAVMPDPDAFELDLSVMQPEDLSAALQPLARHRDKLTAIDGLGMLSAGVSNIAATHEVGHSAAISGAPSNRLRFRGGGGGGYELPSLDQRMATRLRGLEPRLTDLAALSFTVVPTSAEGVPNPGYLYDFRYRDNGGGGVVPVGGETRVSAALARLAPGTTAPRYGQLKAIRTEILDGLSWEYERLASRVGAEDRVRLELHRDLLRDLAARDAILGDSVCAAPGGVADAIGGSPGVRFQETSQSFIDLIAMAFSCDISRVASIQFVEPPVELFDANGDLHGTYAHPAGPDFGRGINDLDRQPEAIRVMTRHMQWHAEQVARLADRLAEIPEGDGTMLDHTAIVWVNEMTHGNHELDQWPVVIVGDLGGSLRTGKYIRLPQTNPTVFGRDRQFCGVPHTRMLASLWAGMGLGEVGFGAASVSGQVQTGPFAGQRAEIALGGVLDELMA